MKANFIENCLNLLFPPVCGFCKQLGKSYLCPSCLKKIERIEKNVLQKYDDKYFDSHFWIFEYTDEIRDRIIEYKFNNEPYLYRFFYEIILNNKRACDYIKCFDYIIAVPLHKDRLRCRGYNQCELITKALEKKVLGTELKNNPLIKVKNIKPQSTLNRQQRELNIVNAFEINPKMRYLQENLTGKSILIFDDVYTTGSTVNECSRLLKECNCKKVGVLTIAKD